MRLTIVGCAGSYPNAESAASCYLVEHEGFSVLLDLGNGALGPLHRYVDPSDIDAVLLSHLHPDHFADMCSLYVARRYRPAGPPPSLPVFGPAGSSSRVAEAYGKEPDPGMSIVFDFEEFPGSSFAVGPFTVTATPVVHPVPAFALRLTAAGRSLTYSGDTAACEALVRAAQDSDVALFEASFRDGDDNPTGVHMTAREAAEIADEAGAERLVLTHMVAWHDNSGAVQEAAVFDGEVLVARPGLVMEV